MSKKSATSKQKVQSKRKEKFQQPQPQQPKQKTQDKNQQEKFSLYTLLQLQNGSKSTLDQIKKQYKKLVMVYHPDKNIGDETAKQKFRKLKQAYDILSDPQKKQIYDQTGSIGDNFDEKSFETAYQYFRGLYKKIQKQDIENFEKTYRNGEMEKEDLIQFYQNHSGDMTTLLECIPLSRNEDITRFISFYEQKIADKTLKKTKFFDKTKNKVRQLQDQTQLFNQTQKKQQQQQMEKLTLAIRNKSNKSFLDSLQQKYGGKKQKAQPILNNSQKKRRKKNV